MLQIPLLGLASYNLSPKRLQIEPPAPDEHAASHIYGKVRFGGVYMTSSYHTRPSIVKGPQKPTMRHKKALNQGHMTHNMALV